MTPEQISVINTIALILEKIGTWPAGTVFVVVAFGPWAMMFFISRGQEKRFEAVAKMYENNVQLVKDYEKVAVTLHDLVILNTQTLTGVSDRIDNNLYCPFMRKTKPHSATEGERGHE